MSAIKEHICGLSGLGCFCPACEIVQEQQEKPKKPYYCGMCEQWFTKGGDCKWCGFKLEKA